MKRGISPAVAVVAILVALVVIGGIGWFIVARGPSTAGSGAESPQLNEFQGGEGDQVPGFDAQDPDQPDGEVSG